MYYAISSRRAVFVASIMLLAAFGVATRAVASGNITTYAGGGPKDGVSAKSIGFIPQSVAIDASGNLYVLDIYRIYKVATNGTVTTVVGNGTPGFSGDNGPATAAQLNYRSDSTLLHLGMVFDAAGNLYFSDYGNHRVRKVTTDGIITTVAGNGNAGYSGDNGPATSAQLGTLHFQYGVFTNLGFGLAVDGAGNLYISDTANNRIRKVAANGIITTVAGNGIAGYSGDNGPAVSAQLNWPSGIAVDAAGNLYIADHMNSRIRRVATNGTITTAAGTGQYDDNGDNGPAASAALNFPVDVAVDLANNLYIATQNRVRKVAANGTISTAAYVTSLGLAVDTVGNLYIGNYYSRTVDKLASSGVSNWVAGNFTIAFSGDGGPATSAQLYASGITFDVEGNLYIAEYDNSRIRKVATDGTITIVAGNGIAGYSGDNGPATSASLSDPWNVAVDNAGNLYIADSGNNRIRKVTKDGIITTVAGNGVGLTGGFSGDNGPATEAQLSWPNAVAIDVDGNLYIADYRNNRIRRVSTNGIITTAAGTGVAGYAGDNGLATAAQLSKPVDITIDPNGNLHIAEEGNNRIRKVAANGIITTVAGNGIAGYDGDGGPAISAALNQPQGITVDTAGNLYISDHENSRIRMAAADGTITTIAGTGMADFGGDGGLATLARINGPVGIAFDAAGDLYFSDNMNSRIRKVAIASASSGTSTTTQSSTTTTSTAQSTTTTNSTTTTTLGAANALDFIVGWNLAGNSSSGTIDVTTATGDVTKVTTVWKWLPAKSNWAFYTPLQADGGVAYATGKGYDILTSIDAGEGFWVNAKAAFTAQLPTGTAVTSASFQGMSSGWNLIAVGDKPTPSQFNVDLSTTPPATGVIPTNLTTLWAWDAGLSNWYFYAPSLEAKGGTALSDYVTSKSYLNFGTKVLDPTMGFWVNRP